MRQAVAQYFPDISKQLLRIVVRCSVFIVYLSCLFYMARYEIRPKPRKDDLLLESIEGRLL